MIKQICWQTLAGLLVLSGFATSASAHMLWLATDGAGHAIAWFGESPADRTYHLPDALAKIAINAAPGTPPLTMKLVDSATLVGLQSDAVVDRDQELYASATYGIYHGTKLTYHVEHLPQADPNDWSDKPRVDAVLQTLLQPTAEGGIALTVLVSGEPRNDLEVKLFSEQGDQLSSARTDDQGRIEFAAAALRPGLNAALVGINKPSASGRYEGEPYNGESNYLTATFYAPQQETAVTEPSTSRSEQVEPAPTASIRPSGLADLPEDLTSFGADLLAGRLYVYGGHTGSAHSYSIAEQSDRFWQLDLADGEAAKWRSLATGPRLQGLALVAAGSKLIRLGGFTAMNQSGEESDLQSQASVAVYDPNVAQWADLPPLPEPRSSFDAAVLDETIYVIGGWQLNGTSNEAQWLTTAWSLAFTRPDAKWRPLATPPMTRRALSVTAHDGRIYAIGGMDQTAGPTTDVQVYDPATNGWSSGPSLPGEGMSGFGNASCECDQRLYVSTYEGNLLRLSEQGDWQQIGELHPGRFFHQMVPVNRHELLIVGGANMEAGKFTELVTIRLP